MKHFTQILLAGLLLPVFFTANLHAAEPKGDKLGQLRDQKSFVSPELAVKELQTAAEAKDRSKFRELFGPDYDKLGTGDEVQDSKNLEKFSAAMAQGCHSVKETDTKIVIEVGTNDWPLPIPLVKEGELWHYDTAAGKEEILNRHIGKDELHAIGVCGEYVKAQGQYFSMNGNSKYARKFKSSAGMKDGLYWPAAENEAPSPLSALVAEAHAEGYVTHHGAGPHPYYGYYFRILTGQGRSAPGGKKNYVHDGEMTAGFALVAYPEIWGQSGIMTFIVNQDGKIYQRDLGEKTGRVAANMKEYDPNNQWTVVEDAGITETDAQR